MMNFREELNKIKSEKGKKKSFYEKAIEKILKQVLEYFEEKEFSESTEILFTIDTHNNVYGRVYLCEGHDKTANFLVNTNSKEDALMVLVFLEQKFKSEGFQLLNETSASRDGCFSVIIKV